MSTEIGIRKAAPPQARQVRIEEVGGDLELSYRSPSGCGACFLLVWLTGWTAGCIMLVRQALSDPSFVNILAAAPFLASWLFVVGVLVWMLFGVERVRLGFEGLEYRLTALVTFSRRRVPRAELNKVRAGMAVRQVGDTEQGAQPCLTFESLGPPIDFACGISEEEQRWLVEWLNEYLDALGPHGPPERSRAGRGDCITMDRRGILRPAATPVEPPSGSRIEWRHHLDTIEFVWRGRWSLAAIAALTLLNLFWNGILGLIICKQVQDSDRFLFFFMIPHEVIGLCFVAAWLLALTAPVWRLTWTFGERQITRRLFASDADAIVFDIGWNKRFDIQPPVRIELRTQEKQKGSRSLWPLLSHPEGEYTLSFLGEKNKELLAINGLTEGDARWIADVLLRSFPSWSRNERSIPT
jgi:hypothetical protein